ncbi:ATPase [Candidatus Dependentiae bacterium HGW-Dependentiae-1]|nr:MAG: ATPase [Candidatus Dependentiae bacterium HGW-Dependentiae-1]
MKDIESTQMLINQIKEESARFNGLPIEIGKVVVGQHEIINFIVIAILSNGHILLEGVPGVAKTTIIKAIHKALGLTFNRIQFTPDLLPADLIGTLIFNQKTHEFETKKGPIFANLILADEINRAPAKVQAALLEAMQEHQVTIGSNSFKLDEPFLVFATQNPLEQEGTYRLPEAQIDRFMFKLLVDYPSVQEEKEIIKKTATIDSLSQVLTKEDIFTAQKLVQAIYVDEKVADYIVSLVSATRTPEAYALKDIKPFILYGASPRATLALYHTAKAHAFLKKRHFVTPDDVKAVTPAVLRHRIVLTYEAEAQEITTDQIIHKMLSTIPAP